MPLRPDQLRKISQILKKRMLDSLVKRKIIQGPEDVRIQDVTPPPSAGFGAEFKVGQEVLFRGHRATVIGQAGSRVLVEWMRTQSRTGRALRPPMKVISAAPRRALTFPPLGTPKR